MKPLFRAPWAPLIVLSIFMVWLVFSLLHKSETGAWMVQSFSIWGDWSAHLAFINSFLERGPGWILDSNPLFAGAPFQYPFLSHWLTAGLTRLLSLDPIRVMLLTSAGLLAILPFLVYAFYTSFGVQQRASLAATLAWLLMGGLQVFDSTLRSDRAVTNQFESGSVLTSFLLYELIPQRAFLFGLVATLAAFLLLLRIRSRIALWLGCGTIVILPLLHLHSWLAAGVLFAALAMFPVAESAHFPVRRTTLRAGLLIAGISGCLAFLLLGRASSYRLAWDLWAPGWAQGADTGLTRAIGMNPLWFWIYNTGLFLPAVLAGLFLSRGNPGLRPFGISGILLFVVALLFRVQPYFYDNLKLLTYSFLFLAPFFGIALQALSSRLVPAAILLLFLQCASTAHDVRFLVSGGERTTWFTAGEEALAAKFKKIRSSPSDLVLTSTSHHHWVPCLAGNPVFMGYPGWLWSWGIAYTYREKEIFEIWTGRPLALELIRRHGIRFIVFERGETLLSHKPNEDFFQKNFKKVLDQDGWVIYSVDTRSPS